MLNILLFAAGHRRISSIVTSGYLWLWGWNGRGQLGDETIISKSSPIQTVAGGADWIQVAAGERDSIAIKAT